MDKPSDIQNYLDSFNKEIEYVDMDDSDDIEEENDVELYHYPPECEYNEDDCGPVLQPDPVQIKIEEEDYSDNENNFLASKDDNSNEANDDADESYQPVTIVPSDTNPGDLAFVLFMSEDGDTVNRTDSDLGVSIYDLNNDERSFLAEKIGPDMMKMHAIRLAPRLPRLSSQPYVCNYCSYSSPKRYLLSRHMKSHSDERPHKCDVCGRGFKTLPSLHNHVNTHTGTRPHPCKDCDSSFTTSGELVRHIRYKHTHEKPHKCTECDYASVELSKLKRHMRCHTGERPYQCPHCTYASPDTYKLKRHLRIHTGEKPYECDICYARFTQSNSLKAHKLIHTGKKPVFPCEYCPTTCGRKTDLRIHMAKLHSSDNPHKCKRCDKIFLDRYSYKIHIKSHEGEKCFKCDLCNYASAAPRHLEAHMCVHFNQKPYECDECDQCFRQKQLLKRHKNLYHDPNYIPPEPKAKNHICKTCSKTFRHKGNLMRHFVLHDPMATEAEKEVALKIGVPKQPGESEDGEEDDYEVIEQVESLDDKGEPVVVFEVIQLPSSSSNRVETQTLTMADGRAVILNSDNRSPTEDKSIYSEENIENVASVSRLVKPYTLGMRSILKREIVDQNRAISVARRGRPPKNTYQSHVLRVLPDKPPLIVYPTDRSTTTRELTQKQRKKECIGSNEENTSLDSPSNQSHQALSCEGKVIS